VSNQPPPSATSDKGISDLRAALFDTLQAVRSGDLDIEKAKAVNELAKTLVDTARVEVEYIKQAGGGESAFLDTAVGNDNLPKGLPNGITGVTRHRLK
jgi:hypothetical protein